MITQQGTKPGQPTIEDIRDMIQNDPRYDKLTRAEMDKVVIKETIRAAKKNNYHFIKNNQNFYIQEKGFLDQLDEQGNTALYYAV